MTHEQFSAYMEQCFDAFCKTVIRNESRNIHKKLKHLAENEKSLSSLSIEEEAELYTENAYFSEGKLFRVDDLWFSVDDKQLAAQLYFLLPNTEN